jgi:hypothetical protein
MTDQLSGCEAAKLLDEPSKTIIVCIAEVIPPGPLRALLYVIGWICIALAPLIFAYYFMLLAHGGAKEGSSERQDYDKLRMSLAGDNLAARLYTKWLTAFLDWIERFFGDAGMADRTLFPHAFGLKTPAPLWTAPAFDRCLLLALVYPIVTVILIWAISGHVGPAEAALGLKPYLSANNPAAPEYWWAYALLLSSMIPSIVNLTIAGMAFTRGIPWLAWLLLQWIPEGKAVPDYRRPLAAIGLTTQMFAGVGLGIAAQAFLVWGIIFHVMPWVGLDLLDMARAVAAFDLPGRIGSLFTGAA